MNMNNSVSGLNCCIIAENTLFLLKLSFSFNDLRQLNLQGADLEGGQSDMRASIDLSLNFAPHEISEGLQSVELGGHISFNQWTIRLAFSYTWLCMTMGTSSWSEHIYLSFCLFVLPSWLKFFLIKEENYLVWIRWFSSGAQRF
jgi:hypothetical protein